MADRKSAAPPSFAEQQQIADRAIAEFIKLAHHIVYGDVPITSYEYGFALGDMSHALDELIRQRWPNPGNARTLR